MQATGSMLLSHRFEYVIPPLIALQVVTVLVLTYLCCGKKESKPNNVAKVKKQVRKKSIKSSDASKDKKKLDKTQETQDSALKDENKKEKQLNVTASKTQTRSLFKTQHDDDDLHEGYEPIGLYLKEGGTASQQAKGASPKKDDRSARNHRMSKELAETQRQSVCEVSASSNRDPGTGNKSGVSGNRTMPPEDYGSARELECVVKEIKQHAKMKHINVKENAEDSAKTVKTATAQQVLSDVTKALASVDWKANAAAAAEKAAVLAALTQYLSTAQSKEGKGEKTAVKTEGKDAAKKTAKFAIDAGKTPSKGGQSDHSNLPRPNDDNKAGDPLTLDTIAGDTSKVGGKKLINENTKHATKTSRSVSNQSGTNEDESSASSKGSKKETDTKSTDKAKSK